MPTSTIPFDPGLVLGMIVQPERIAQLEEIAEAQVPVDLARDHLNALIRQKMSLDMTTQELISLGVGYDQMAQLDDTRTKLEDAMASAAGELAQAVIAAEAKIVALKAEQGQKQIASALQSPIDLSESQLKPLPISADSMNMDVQFFRWEENSQQDSTTASAISSFVGVKVSSFLGGTYGAQAAASAHQSAVQTANTHNIIGTLVICANCTSKTAQMFSPVRLDPDAAIDSYNRTFDDALKTDDIPTMRKLALTPGEDDSGETLPVLIGATYGSSFVGFVHFEQIEATQSSQESSSNAEQASASAERGLFFADIEGSFGLDRQSSQSVKNLLSTSNIQSHCSLITMGLIPSIKSNQVKASVKSMKDDPTELMNQLAAMQGASDEGMQTMASAAVKARSGNSIEKMKADYISATVSALADVDEQANNVIDLNSLQTALDDYVSKAAGENIGVPINFYLKYVTKGDIAQAWMEKYYPDQLHLKVDSGSDSSGGGSDS